MPIRRCSGEFDEEQTAEGPERLTSQGGLGLLIDEQHPPSCVCQLGGGHEARQAASHDDHISGACGAGLGQMGSSGWVLRPASGPLVGRDATQTAR